MAARETVPDQEMASTDEQDPRIAKIAKAIRVIPDFPKPGTHLRLRMPISRLRDPFFCFISAPFGFVGDGYFLVLGFELNCLE